MAHSGGGATCIAPANCSLCGKSYAPHDYVWKNDGTNHWLECTRDASHKTNHGTCSGGTATCNDRATCSTCNQPYGQLNPENHVWTNWEPYPYVLSTMHYRTCQYCTNIKENEYCDPQPNCTSQVQCKKCYVRYPVRDDNHSWGSWTSNGNGTHTRTCTLNGSHKETKNCSGDSSATCSVAGTCTTCGGQYKDSQVHQPTYTASGDTITETCSGNCGHSQIATLQFKENADLTYTGSGITPMEMVYPEGWVGEKKQPTAANYSSNVDAGTDSASCTFTYATGVTVSKSFSIARATLYPTMVTVAPPYSGYTGQTHTTPTVSLYHGSYTLTEGTDYTLSSWSGELKDANSYTMTITGMGNFQGTTTATYKITQAVPTANLFQIEYPQNPVYDGTTAYSATVTSDAPGIGTFTVKYNGSADAPVNAGTYTVTVDVAEGTNYKAISGLALGSFTVKKADAAITVAPNQVATYDGAATTTGTADADILYTYPGDIADVIVKWYNADGTDFTGGTPTNVGSYIVGISAAEGSNYNAVDEVKAPFTIIKADPVIGAVTAADIKNSTDVSKISLSRADTSVDGALTVDAGQRLNWGDNTIAYTFTPTDLENYNILTGTVNVKVVDTIVPTGIVTLAEKDWSALLENFQFDLFFKEAQTVVVDAQDNLSGVDTIEYYATSDSLDVAALNAVRDWTVMNSGSTVVALEDTRQFIYYIRLTDKAGNVAYISTNGAEFDTTAPVISGITNGETYYTTHTVTVTDKNLYTVTLNGSAVTSPITLEGNKEATYTIVATDKAGNSTSCTVTMKPIASLTDNIASLTEDNVTSDHLAALGSADAALHAAMDQGTPSDSELALLRSAIDRIAKLENAVEEALTAVDTDSINSSLDIDADNVLPENKTQLETAKAELEDALEEHAGNYTPAEQQIIQDKIDQFADALAVLAAVEDVTEQVTALPETADPTQEAVVLAIDQAKAAYDALSDHGKELAGTAIKEKLDALVADITAYAIISGNGSSWTKDGSSGLRFTANGIFSKFVGVKIDGKDLAASNYTAVSGSTVVTLKPAYLQKLRNGSHTITLVYTDGQTSGSFTVVANHNNPDTGDNTGIALWTCLLAMSAAALALLSKKRRAVK